MRILNQVRQAVSNLNPNGVRETAERRVDIQLRATSSATYAAMEDLLMPAGVSRKRRMEQMTCVHRSGDAGSPAQFDLVICEEGMPRPDKAVVFYPQSPVLLVEDILRARDDLGLPLARAFPAFRAKVTDRIITSVARENAVFALTTALPNLAPGLISLPWAASEMASDTAFLTVNQVRMAFLLAAASDRPAGYGEQRSEIASIIAGAFGFRAVARELVSKIPFGGGLIPKAGIAFAGTYVVGLSLERVYRLGYGLTRGERRAAYGEALERGKQYAARLLEIWRNRRPRQVEPPAG